MSYTTYYCTVCVLGGSTAAAAAAAICCDQEAHDEQSIADRQSAVESARQRTLLGMDAFQFSRCAVPLCDRGHHDEYDYDDCKKYIIPFDLPSW